MPVVQHMVVVKFKSSVPQQKIDELFAELRAFWSKMPGITYFAGGRYSSPEGLNQGYTNGFLVTFTSPAARDAYLTHPEHQRVVDLILPMLTGAACDFNPSVGTQRRWIMFGAAMVSDFGYREAHQPSPTPTSVHWLVQSWRSNKTQLAASGATTTKRNVPVASLARRVDGNVAMR